MKTPKTMIRELLSLPAKAYLTLFTVGVGIGILILALSVSDSFARNILDRISKNGVIVNVANATWTEEGGLDPVRPGEFDENVMSILMSDISGVKTAAPLVSPDVRDVTVDGKVYQVRRITGSTPEYLDIMDLTIIAGSQFTTQDVADGSLKILVSESTAEMLYGGSEEAIGKLIQPPVRNLRIVTPSGSTERRQVAQPYTIVGVFRDPAEVKRKSYGIGDIIIPYTATLPAGGNRSMMMRFMLNTITLKIEGTSFDRAEAQIRTALSAEYGDDITLHIWEGEPNGNTNVLSEIRKTVSTFSLVVNLLGFVLLISGSIGILSIMIVEILAKTRDIAIERALGAARHTIVAEYFTRAILMSAGSSVIGIVISLIFSRPLSSLLLPILSGLDITVKISSIVSPYAVVIGTASALITGGVFGTLPIFSSFKAPISESIREG